jgi:glycosyltransferase involved in cell wall biosynthesis
MLSIVIPIHNEEPSILPLYDRLTAVLERLKRPYEVLFVDDASSDRSFELLANLVETDGHLTVIRLRRNFGQTAALSAGFHEAQGEIVIAMDGDLQHAPEDIPALLEKVDRDTISPAAGGSTRRQPLLRKIPSRIANWMMAKASGVDLRDFGTTFKAYRADVLKDVHLYGELHRFIPALASFYGARIAEVPIQNSLRTAGDSHYGLGRTFRVLFDIVTIRFLLRYFTRPMHFFGTLGLAGTTLGGAIMLYLGVSKILGVDIIAEHGPLMVLGGLLLLAGLIMFNTGFIGEMLMRTYFESQDRQIYADPRNPHSQAARRGRPCPARWNTARDARAVRDRFEGTGRRGRGRLPGGHSHGRRNRCAGRRRLPEILPHDFRKTKARLGRRVESAA